MKSIGTNIKGVCRWLRGEPLKASPAPAKIRAYRIRWAWARGRQTFTAVTTWVFPGDAIAALKNFKQRNPEAITANIEEVA